MKKNLLLIGIGLMLSFAPAFAANNCVGNASCNENDVLPCKDVFTRMYNERATMYNVLGLSPDQAKIKDEIEKRHYVEVDAKVNQLAQEKYVLLKLSQNNASDKAVNKQKCVVNNIKNEIEKMSHKYDHEFKSILSAEQKAKYNAVKKMEYREIKNCQKNQKYYKQDPHLRPFGEKMYFYSVG